MNKNVFKLLIAAWSTDRRPWGCGRWLWSFGRQTWSSATRYWGYIQIFTSHSSLIFVSYKINWANYGGCFIINILVGWCGITHQRITAVRWNRVRVKRTIFSEPWFGTNISGELNQLQRKLIAFSHIPFNVGIVVYVGVKTVKSLLFRRFIWPLCLRISTNFLLELETEYRRLDFHTQILIFSFLSSDEWINSEIYKTMLSFKLHWLIQVIVQTSLGKEELKSAIMTCTNRVEWNKMVSPSIN